MTAPVKNAASFGGSIFYIIYYLLRVIDGLRLAQDVHLYLTGVGKLTLDLLGDIPCQKHHLILADVLWLDHDAYLAAGLNGIGACDAGKAL